MKQGELKKYIIIFIAIMFVISMFYSFKNTTIQTNEPTANTTTGTAVATCRISAFGSEVIVQPWDNQTIAIAKGLKDGGYLDYINTDGKKGFLILSSKSNLTDVRYAYLATDATVLVQASCLVNGLVNFTMANGSSSQQAPGVLRMYLDPFSQVGDEIDIDMTADIDESGIQSMVANPVPRTGQGTTDAAMQCFDYYVVVGGVSWENKDLNLTEVSSLLNISESNINYSRNDIIVFNKQLNQTQLEEMRADINSSGMTYITQVIDQGMLANTTEKQAIVDLLGKYGVNGSFQPSEIVIYADTKEKFNSAVEYFQAKGTIVSEQKACTMKTAMFATLNGTEMYIPSDLRKVEYYVPIERISKNDTATIIVNLETTGRIVSSLTFVNVQ